MEEKLYNSLSIEVEPTLKDYMPDIYEGVLEMEELMEAENQIFSRALDSTVSLLNNQYVLSSDKQGIERYEKLFNIPQKSGKNLEDRRRGVLFRLYTSEPFTLNYLNNLLSQIAVGSYAEISVPSQLKNPTIRLVLNDNSEGVWEDITHLFLRMSPLNISSEFEFTYNHELDITETVSAIGTQFNYVLGKWKLGNKPFASHSDEVVVNDKMVKTLDEYNMSKLIFNDVSAPIVFNDAEATIHLPEDISSNMGTSAWEVKYTLPEELGKLTYIGIIGNDARVELDTDLEIYGKASVLHNLRVKDRIQVI